MFGILLIISMTVTDIYEAMNSKAEAFFEWLQAHPKYGLLFGVGLLALWLAGLLFRWKWACEWQFHGKLWFFDYTYIGWFLCMEITVWKRTIANTGSASSTICGM